jgi:hypothetical protein
MKTVVRVGHDLLMHPAHFETIKNALAQASEGANEPDWACKVCGVRYSRFIENDRCGERRSFHHWGARI